MSAPISNLNRPMKKAHLPSAGPGTSLRPDAILPSYARRPSDGITVLRLHLLVRCIGPSRYPRAGGYASFARPPRAPRSWDLFDRPEKRVFQHSVKSQMGFTLIELTIAMTLLALMTVILYGAFYLGQRAIEKAQVRNEESQRLRSVEEILAGYIRSAYPYRATLKDPTIFFSGEENRLTFVSAQSLGMGGRGMAEVSISWNGEGDGTGQLKLEEQIPVRLEEESVGEGYRSGVVLGEAVTAFHMDYLDPQSEEERWVHQWDGREKKSLPRAVRLSQRGKRGEEIRWVFPVMMTVLAP
jgi:general secretion pathway protein J